MSKRNNKINFKMEKLQGDTIDEILENYESVSVYRAAEAKCALELLRTALKFKAH